MAFCGTKDPTEEPNGGDDDRENPKKMNGESCAEQNESEKQNQ